MKVYTRKGDDGTTGLLFGGRVSKRDDRPKAYGAVDEAQAFLGLARAEAERGSELDTLLIELERDLWILMSELATAPENRDKLIPDKTLVTAAMIERVEAHIDSTSERFEQLTEFLVPGQNRTAALLDVARAVVRRAEREAISAAHDQSLALAYLNRLSDLLWSLARWQEDDPLRSKH